MASYVVLDATVLNNIVNGAGGSQQKAFELFNTLMKPGQTVVVTDTVKNEVVKNLDFNRDKWVSAWLDSMKSLIGLQGQPLLIEPQTNIPLGPNAGEQSMQL